MELITAAQAANKLSVSERQIRRLAATGDLPGRRVGDRWLLDADAVRQRSRSERHRGRPLSAQMAWTVLLVASSVLETETSTDPVAQIKDRRVRHRLRRLLADAPASEYWDQWLRHRADPQRAWFHPGVIDRLAKDDRLHPVGSPVVDALGDGIAKRNRCIYYVDEDVVTRVLADYRARPAEDGQVLLMVIPSVVPDEVLGEPGRPVSPAAALVDLLGSPDARERHVAASTLEAARHRLVSTSIGS